MSKTDKTQPYWLRMRDHNVRAVHDHRDGVCDIVPLENNRDWWSPGCHYRYWWYGCCTGCGCAMCTDQADRKRKARRERAKGKRECLEGLAEYRT